MRIIVVLLVLLFLSCGEQPDPPKVFTEVSMNVLYQDSISVRALEIMESSLAFGANNGIFGSVDLKTEKVRTGVQTLDSIAPEFRAISHTQTDFFMLSAGNPALLYKTGDTGAMELVYSETGEQVFYDAMAFWNNQEGLAMGDIQGDCLSILITRDGGHNWSKLPCSELPPALEGEGAFAASNTNIAIAGDTAWIATTKARIFS